MSLLTIGRTDRVELGKKAVFKFRVRFRTLVRPSNPTLTNAFGATDSYPIAGDLVIAGITVTLTDSDITSTTRVAMKIAAASITGYTVYNTENEVVLVNNIVGVTAKPVISVGTTKNISFDSYIFAAGEAIPTTFPDIFIGGRVPCVIQVVGTGGTFVISQSPGDSEDQKRGSLTYSPISLSTNMATISNPTSFLKITTNTGCTQIILNITR